MTNQPVWEYVGNLGDNSPIDHGGFFVFRDKTGVYEAEAEIYDPEERKVWRFTLEQQVKYPEGLVALCWVKNPLRIKSGEPPEGRANGEWWFDSIDSVCLFCDVERGDFIDRICSDDPLERARAYRDLVHYHGEEEFDQYPIRLKRAEAIKRYREMGAINEWGTAL